MWEEVGAWGLFWRLTLCWSSQLVTLLGLCFSNSRPFRPLLPQLSYLDGQSPRLGREHLSAY